MFRHILIPTGGSRLARKGVKAGVKLAAKLGARARVLSHSKLPVLVTR